MGNIVVSFNYYLNNNNNNTLVLGKVYFHYQSQSFGLKMLNPTKGQT